MPSSLISHQWEGAFQKKVITISSNETGELTPTPAVTYCPTASRLVLAVTFPKSPVQSEQLWMITSSSSWSKDRVYEWAEIARFHGFIQSCEIKEVPPLFLEWPSLTATLTIAGTICMPQNPNTLSPPLWCGRARSCCRAVFLCNPTGKSCQHHAKQQAGGWPQGWGCQGPWWGQDRSFIFPEVTAVEEIKGVFWSNTFSSLILSFIHL